MTDVIKASVLCTYFYGVLAVYFMLISNKFTQFIANQNYKDSNLLPYLVVFYNVAR